MPSPQLTSPLDVRWSAEPCPATLELPCIGDKAVRRSRKSLGAVRSLEGSNPSPSADNPNPRQRCGIEQERGGRRARLSHRLKPLGTAMGCRATVAQASRSERDAGEGGARLPGACSTGNKCWGQVTGSPGALSRSRTLKVTASGLLPWFHGGVGNFVAPLGHELEMDMLSTTKSTPASYSSAGCGRSIGAAAPGGGRLAWDDVPPLTSAEGFNRAWVGRPASDEEY
jgi:hypothetical protein